MIQAPSTMVQAALKAIFWDAAQIEFTVWEEPGMPPDVVAQTRFFFSGYDAERAADRGPRELMEYVYSRLGGGRMAWEKKLRAVVVERERPFSMKAGRRAGKHKRVVP
jgi:hypothetical protein